MNVEPFLKLKEYDSLLKQKDTILMAIKDQERRLFLLQERKISTLKQIETTKKEFVQNQQSIAELELKLNNAELQAKRLSEIGGDETKINNLKFEAVSYETQAFALIEKNDQLGQEIQDHQTFIKGLEKTTQEISLEVGVELENLNTQLNNIQLRSSYLFDELPKEFQNVLSSTLNKKLAVGSFTRIENGSCFFCRYKISRTDESEIDMQKKLKVCPQCSRIFLPYGA